MDDTKEYAAPVMLRAAIDQLWSDVTRDRVTRIAETEGAHVAAIDQLFFDLRLPRQSGKTTAILDEVAPGDVVFCRDARNAKWFEERLKYMRTIGSPDAAVPAAIYTAYEVEYAIKEIGGFFSYFTHTIFFDEVPNAREIAGTMANTLYNRNFRELVERGYHPRFISLRS